jgi:ethanolamine utilization protein EutN
MKIGKVTGSVWSSRKAPSLQGQTFLVVCCGQEELVAADQVGAGQGDRVLLVTGTVASRFCMEAPVDAAVVAILDPEKNAD